MRRNSKIVVSFAALFCPIIHAADQCIPMTPRQRAYLESYVRKRYNLPAGATLQLAETPAAESSCFRKIELKSADQGRNFNLTLYASPDLRFLTPRLFDTRVDPLEEERKRKEAFLAALNSRDAPAIGPANAPVTMTVFSDFQCPYCAKLAHALRQDVLPKESGSLRVVFRYFPLSMHVWARTAGEIEVCANEQSPDLFWTLHDFIFENQRTFTPENIAPKILEQAGRLKKIDRSRLTACLADKRTDAIIDRDVALGTANGVSGTPTIFVNGERVNVSSEPEQLRSLIREASARPAISSRTSR